MPHCSGHFLTERGFYRARLCHDFNKLYRPRTLMSLLDNKPLVRGKLCPAAEGNPPRGILFLSSRISFASQNKCREGWRRLILTGGLARELFCHSKNNKRQVWRKLCPAAEGNPPRGISFLSSRISFASQNKCREGWNLLILTGGLAHELFCHSKNNKRQVWHKLSPAAEGNPPRGSNL